MHIDMLFLFRGDSYGHALFTNVIINNMNRLTMELLAPNKTKWKIWVFILYKTHEIVNPYNVYSKRNYKIPLQYRSFFYPHPVLLFIVIFSNSLPKLARRRMMEILQQRGKSSPGR